ncbi:hypothetical protein [Amaricoccus sp.]|uniref:hypothetical protein n=1 Tax=Amaricoccus sp. TaxID=1872485 RepID=UPI001B51ECFC|nr:hypothetical protein [Amaricoccus sp.]MBP7003175.1 hypothetical protein [Amaricoccus sp.]
MTPSPFRDQDLGIGADELLSLAGSYHAAAETLLGAEADAATRAPARFCALQAIELYLDAFLRALGESPGRLRAHGHDLRLRAALAIELGLEIRRKTALHLVRLTLDRENLALRYGPIRPLEPCELNRLRRSLDEIGSKVRAAVAAAPHPRGAAA